MHLPGHFRCPLASLVGTLWIAWSPSLSQVPPGTATEGFTTVITDSGARRLLKAFSPQKAEIRSALAPQVCYCERVASASSDGACGAADWQHAGQGLSTLPGANEIKTLVLSGTLSLVGFAGSTARGLRLEGLLRIMFKDRLQTSQGSLPKQY